MLQKPGSALTRANWLACRLDFAYLTILSKRFLVDLLSLLGEGGVCYCVIYG